MPDRYCISCGGGPIANQTVCNNCLDTRDHIDMVNASRREPRLKLYRLFIGPVRSPDSKVRKNGDLRKFANGGVMYALGTDGPSLIGVLRTGILREVEPDNIVADEVEGPFTHGSVLSYREN